ncbi:MAG: hydroxymethylbilane synthase [Desulfobulbus sp.]|jgi:hydroxymethylbilane synthase|uniref:hydroxymethylbilane synthase n=1 Tax=Desulfobulbus sp. TaxID=895 RepID=UPI00284794E2|nr:hydroxymethylbilane synthase [Desulfobulbus sp.]MDR2549835.1 hydroxymethylbilane synthase [Desulfobulbus sp.]
MRTSLRIGTRASLLAVTQSTWVKDRIEQAHPGIRVELVKITTKGDRILDVPLAKVGGKGLFVKEIEDALLAGEVDLAVHSMKDVPTELPAGLHIGIVPQRETPYDAFLSVKYDSIAALPANATVGTSSLRRRSQLAAMRPDLTIVDLRGNIDTRLRKLDEGVFDAIILAGAGLHRLGLAARITTLLEPTQMLPAIGQGALGIELRRDDTELLAGMQFLHHPATASTVAAERAFLLRLEGGCQVPIGAHATLTGDSLSLAGLIASVDGRELIKDTATASAGQAAKLGADLAETLLDRGGKAILDAVYCAGSSGG